MKPSIVFQWIDPAPSDRLAVAQVNLKRSVIDLGLDPKIFPAGPKLVKFRDILDFAFEQSTGDSFVWCNSDVILTRNPYEMDEGNFVRGFHRTEIPSGEICGGVDMYLIPKVHWTGYLRREMPDLWCGATHIDWWLTRAASLAGHYCAHFGYLDHPSHEESGASKSRTNRYYRHNVMAYNSWARRNGAAQDQRRHKLPIIGESLSPITDYARWVKDSLRFRK